MSIISSIALLGGIGAIGGALLFVASKRFKVEEDPRIDDVEALLPGANCGACGLKGCRDFATSCVKAGNLEGFFCPSAGASAMERIAAYLGVSASMGKRTPIAVVRCQGTSATKTPLDAAYAGPRVCSIMGMTAGDYACLDSCLGCGDCVEACPWDAIHISTESGLPAVEADKCVGCGNCANACPRSIIEIRRRGVVTKQGERRVWVACSNCQKGGITRKQCTVGCIGCSKCVKACPFDAIHVSNNLAHIEATKCRTCGKCIPVCPTGAILSVNVVKNEDSDL